ncbi:MAG: ABC transporter permease [Myxococcota bacterium]|nr:ABC transporter permease [Myxococcota bacterium]
MTSPATIIIYIAAMIIAAVALNLGGWWGTLRIFDRMGVKMRFEPFVAVRHLKGRKSGFLTAIGVLSILGVSFSSCTLTTVLSVMGGFSGELKDNIFNTKAHLLVDNYGQDIENWQPLLAALDKVEGVVAATPIIHHDMMMSARTNNSPIKLIGVDLKSFPSVSSVLSDLEKGSAAYLKAPEKLFEKIREKRRNRYGSPSGAADAGVGKGKATAPKTAGLPTPSVTPRQRVLPAVVVGREIAKGLRLYEGVEVNIINPIGGIGPTGPIPKMRPFRVAGIFFSGMIDFDNFFVYTTMKDAQTYLNKPGKITEIQIAIEDPDDAQAVSASVAEALGAKWRVRSWIELNAPLFSALKLEKIVMFILLSLAILVASFCIIATLTMLVLEKGAEVSVMMTLGASPRNIQSIFRFEGFLIGMVGTISGLLVGFGLCMTVDKIGLPIDAEVWYIDTLPVRMEWVEFLLVGLASLIITQIATLYPVHVAAKLTPVEGLKNE